MVTPREARGHVRGLATPERTAYQALRAVTLANEVERHARGVGRPKLRELAKLTDDRVLEAFHAGATTRDIGQALSVGISRAQERLRRAQKAAGEWAPPRRLETGSDANLVVQDNEVVVSLAPPDPGPPLEAPKVWLEVPRCAAPLPPPWPVWARCELHAHTSQTEHGCH